MTEKSNPPMTCNHVSGEWKLVISFSFLCKHFVKVNEQTHTEALHCCINFWDRHWFSHTAPDNNRGNLLPLLWRWITDFISPKYSRYILKTFHLNLIQLVKIASNQWVYFEGRKKQGIGFSCDQIPTRGVGMLPTGSIHTDQIWLECFECFVQLPSTFFCVSQIWYK